MPLKMHPAHTAELHRPSASPPRSLTESTKELVPSTSTSTVCETSPLLDIHRSTIPHTTPGDEISSVFPIKQTLVLCLCKVSESMVVCFIMPFVNQMVASFGTPAAQSAQYAGLIESALVLTEAIFAPLWGTVADKHGRKPLLVSGLSAFTLASLAIGLSKSLWMAIAARCVSGVLGAVSVLLRTVQFEISDASSTDKVLEYLTPCWAIGAAIGPMIGGLLAEPARTMPHLFTWQVWTTFPYLLPSLVTSLMPLASAVACLLYIPETLDKKGAVAVDESPLVNHIEDIEEGSDMTVLDLMRIPKLFYTLVVAALLAFVSMAYCAGFMMMASTSLEDGGLGLSPAQLGLMLAVSSILGVLVGTYAIPHLVSKLNLGWYATLRYSAFAHVCLFPLIALTGCLAKWENGLGPCTIAIIGLVLLCYEFGEMGYTGVDVAFADRAPEGCLARVNGLSLSASSIGRMLAPALSGQLWSLSLRLPSPIGRNLIWLIFTILAIIWFISTLRLFSPDEIARKCYDRRYAKSEAASAVAQESGSEEWDEYVVMGAKGSSRGKQHEWKGARRSYGSVSTLVNGVGFENGMLPRSRSGSVVWDCEGEDYVKQALGGKENER